jgi:pre-mRNA-splicing factor CDC5/CEF1
MKFIRKGGVWKNTEDEILKAAVMKYGKNQWARVSSLLVRKSPQQCKARWYEWLDPSVRKTDWTRDEEERLLHLAKAMPCQWRTIAPLVGRTAAQCLEHYSELLDQAAGGDAEDGMLSQIRKPRPGEVDPDIETRPAKPDSVDMDEDEKEMLQEARARLANTKGKKAKRKAREKQLQEARRIASLQKKRELKAAGIETLSKTQSGGKNQKKKKRKHPGVDYNAEIPFQRATPLGFYDTTEDDQVAKRMKVTDKDFKPISIVELEGERKEIIEARERKKDTMKQKLLKQYNLPEYVKRIAKLNEKGETRVRPQLILPAPQISADEFEDVVKMNTQTVSALNEAGGLMLGSTTQMISDLATPTPMRTPRKVDVGGDELLKKAQDLLTLTSAQTPLVGGYDAPLVSSMQTPLISVPETPQPMAKKTMNKGHQIRAMLSSLPAPVNEYDFEVPVDQESSPVEKVDQDVEMDMEEIVALRMKRQLEEENERKLRQSSVIQRSFPVPQVCDDVPHLRHEDPRLDSISRMIAKEAKEIILHDIGQANSFDTDELSSEQLKAARSLIEAESNGFSIEDAEFIYEANSADVPQELIMESLVHLSKVNNKIYSKLSTLNKGFLNRVNGLHQKRSDLVEQVSLLEIEHSCFEILAENEVLAADARLRFWKTKVAEAKAVEAELQEEYAALINN